ncbi:hypothetical protein EYC80_006908 [Monilinia laxa]|uniref:BTB domain-containing protein n=1 Tax=Monilinia laxa TaxID=61186 RepID=A0A5N6JZJ2_MONLA|nr:hypothetical protein EYC80_006908 [Monilinia laxa]
MTDALDAIRALYDTGKYADMKICCEDRVFDVHRAVVCMRSPVLAAAMDNDCWEEAAKSEYHMGDDELPIVEAMIRYFYHGTYDDQVALGNEPSEDGSQLGIENAGLPPSPLSPEVDLIVEEIPPEPQAGGWGITPSESSGGLLWGRRQEGRFGFVQQAQPEVSPEPAADSTPSSLLFNAKVYIIADKYMIPALKDLANEKCLRGVEAHWNTPEFSKVAELLWENTAESDKMLRDAVLTAAAAHSDGLLDRGEFVEFMSGHGDFAVEVMKKARDLPGRRKGKKDIVNAVNHHNVDNEFEESFSEGVSNQIEGLQLPSIFGGEDEMHGTSSRLDDTIEITNGRIEGTYYA